MSRIALVTGAFSNIGSAVAATLAARGWAVRTLTNRPPRGVQDVPRQPLLFDAEHLRGAMAGADVFVNTYWVRFPHHRVTFDTAIGNIQLLIDAARASGVRRFVQVSVSNASEASPLGYYRGKALVEAAVRRSGLSSAIVRPTLVVGPHDVLTGNIAWFLRLFPLCAVPAGAEYRLQPVTLQDAGRIIADAAESTDAVEVDAAGPDIIAFADYLRLVAQAVGKPHRRFVRLPPAVFLALLGLLNPFMRDTILTREELEGLRADLLVSRQPPLGTESALVWLREHGDALGRHYVNDTVARFKPPRITPGVISSSWRR